MWRWRKRGKRGRYNGEMEVREETNRDMSPSNSPRVGEISIPKLRFLTEKPPACTWSGGRGEDEGTFSQSQLNFSPKAPSYEEGSHNDRRRNHQEHKQGCQKRESRKERQGTTTE